MIIPRAILIVLLTGSVGVPYAAPMLCTLLRPGMVGMSTTMAQHPTTLTTSDDSGTACDFARCAVAPAAPVAIGSVEPAFSPFEHALVLYKVVDLGKHFFQPPTPPPIA